MANLSSWARATICSLAAPLVLHGAAGGAVVYPNLPYASPGAPGNMQMLDVYVPNPGVPVQPVTFVLVHGGSYASGSRTDVRPLGLALADLGYPSVGISYTLATAQTPSFPQPINDVLNAVRWVRTTGTDFGLPNRVFLWGHSAGATIAMTAAMSADRPVPVFTPHSDPPPNRGYIIDGIVGLSGRYDIVWNVNVGIPATVVQYVGVPLNSSQWPAAYSAASAVTYVSPCAPPTVLYHGAADTIVPPANSTRLATRLEQAAVQYRLNLVHNGGHGPDITGWTPLQQAQTAASAAQWILSVTTQACGRVPLVPPTGACCPGDGTCTVTELVDCPIGDGWNEGETCAPSPCPAVGACCVAGNCRVSQQNECFGVWMVDAACAPGLCEPFAVVGVCCQGASCAVVRLDQCPSPGVFVRDRSSCSGVGDDRACRTADFNKDRAVTISDVLGYLEAWFALDVSAATSRAPARPTLQDLFDFLTAWFAG